MTTKLDTLLASSKKVSHPVFDFLNFDSIKITIASPDKIRSWSYGEVKKPETINYRTFKPERDGLFCERIFGPIRDWECNCGKYKFIKHKGLICDRCGVEVTESKVRRERMGHIELASPVAHIWFLRKQPSKIGILLDMSLIDLEKVIYYLKYLVMDDLKDDDGKIIIKAKTLLSIDNYYKYKQEYKDKLKAEIGASAIRKLLERIDLQKEIDKINTELVKIRSDLERARAIRKLRLLEGFQQSDTRPEWIILTVLPVIPPDLRPLVPLEGGRFASSDLNDLYRRIINRNNRLRHINTLKAPDIMVNNEKRLLQEAVDALIENGARGNPVVGAGSRPLKSFTDIMKGKHGRFRQNLLGKRVDYSGRSVIVVGPNLKLHQCGLPKEMAIELFKPFILHELINQYNLTLKAAKRMIEKNSTEVLEALEKIVKKHVVLLNRAPTLHRMSIQAFEPVLVEGKAITLHPLTCAAFNADFDGDQMAVHIPILPSAQIEARLLMLASNNILSPANGKPITITSQDMVLGCMYMTEEKRGVFSEGMIFSNIDEVISAYQNKKISLHARIKILGLNEIFESSFTSRQDLSNPDKWKDYTTCGRVLFNQILPPELRYVNYPVGKKQLLELIEKCYNKLGHYRTVVLLDDLKKLGYEYATISGLSISITDMKVPTLKQEKIKKAHQEIKLIEQQAKQGLITEAERYNKIIDIWTHVTDEITDLMFEEMKMDSTEKYSPDKPRFNSVYLMAHSGARGNQQQVRQLAGMRGLMARPQKRLTGQIGGEIIETPILSNFREGLSVLEYFVSTHGGRKGLADTALKTSDAGYLTRRLIDVSHNVVVTEQDCGTINGIRISALVSGEEIIESFEERIIGRVALDNIAIDTESGVEIVIKENEMITPEQAKRIASADISSIRIRSVLTCEAKYGICAKCYGMNLATGRLVEVGETVGIMAAQSIGEPGTQLTLRTFHIGGTASRVIIRSKIYADENSVVKYYNLKAVKTKEGNLIAITRNSDIVINKIQTKRREIHRLPYGAKLMVKDQQEVLRGQLIAEWDPYSLPIVNEFEGKVKYENIIEGKTVHIEKSKITGLAEKVIIEHRVEKKLIPQISIVDKAGKKLVSYPLPVDTIIVVENNQDVYQGDILAKIPQEIIKTKDITGGLPRIVELFEARHSKNSAIISEIDGIVELGMTPKGAQKVTIVNEQTKMSREYIIPHGRHLVIYAGDKVGAGEPLTDGSIDPHDILRVKGPKEVQEFLVNEIQQVYRLQGVNINDKHIEIIVRQMLTNVRIVNSGSSKFIYGEIVSRQDYEKEKERILSLKKKIRKEKGKEEANKIKIPEMQPILLGITKASLSSESFISAASFQETTKTLTDAAVTGQIDYLRGLKENVIVGHLIPAGTGLNLD